MIHVLAFGHETLLEGPEDQSARCGGPRGAEGRGGEDLLVLGTDHQTLAQAAWRDRGSGGQAHTRTPSPEGHGARRVAATAPRKERVRELVEGRGANLLFLPSYSPELNPIEEALYKIKNVVRKAGARTREALNEAISEAISAVTLEDAAGWFGHCGYRS
jgi:hypothetical protein